MSVSSGPSESDLSKSSCTRAPTTQQSTFPPHRGFVPPGFPSVVGEGVLQEGRSGQIAVGFAGGGSWGSNSGELAGFFHVISSHQKAP